MTLKHSSVGLLLTAIPVTILWMAYGSVWLDERRTLEELMPKWEKEIRQRMERDPVLKPLGEKYPLVILVSNFHYPKLERNTYFRHSALPRVEVNPVTRNIEEG